MCVQLSLPEERIRIIFIDKSLYRLYLDCNALPFEFIDRNHIENHIVNIYFMNVKISTTLHRQISLLFIGK